MFIVNNFVACIKNYAGFSGRASRPEFWYFILMYMLIYIVVGIIDSVIGTAPILTGVFALALLVPYLATTIRRLHDTGRSGWWVLIALVPLVGGLALIYFLVLKGQEGENQFGEATTIAAPEIKSPIAR